MTYIGHPWDKVYCVG